MKKKINPLITTDLHQLVEAGKDFYFFKFIEGNLHLQIGCPEQPLSDSFCLVWVHYCVWSMEGAKVKLEILDP